MSNSSNNIDTQTLIHAGTELVVISGITFWLNKKITSNEDEIKILKEKISKLEEIIARQNQMLISHENVLTAITSGQNRPSAERMTRPPETYSPIPPDTEQPHDVTSSKDHSTRRYDQSHRTSRIPTSISVPDPIIATEDIDEILSREIAELEEGRRNCEDSECEILPKKKKKSKKV